MGGLMMLRSLKLEGLTEDEKAGTSQVRPAWRTGRA